MNNRLWQEIEDLYHSVADCEPARRDALLADASPEARETVLKMLVLPAGDNILERPIWITEGESSATVYLETGARLGPYEIQGLLGEGGMGAVYRAWDSRLKREVAIKILPSALGDDPVRLRRFEQEARLAGALSHPNILTVFDVGTHDGTSYLVTELLHGRTLRDDLRGGKFPRAKAMNFARMIAAGLTAAHEKGITHRDLKPENLFVTRDGRVKILDFGLAKFAGPRDGTSALTEPGPAETQSAASHPGLVVGTVGYMSPEQAQGTAVDSRSDLFNLGIVLHEMITGRRPFHGETPIETLHAIVKQDPSLDDPAIDLTLARFLRHCLEKDPTNRFQSGKDLAFDLDGLEPLPIGPPVRRYKWVVPALTAATVTLGLLLIAYRVIPRSEPQPSFSTITFREGNITNARFTPDGHTILFSAAWNGEPMETYRTASGREAQSMGIPNAGIADISSSGEVALIVDCETSWGECEGTLAKVPQDGGVPREMLPYVHSAGWDPHGELAAVRSVGVDWWIEYLGKKLYETRSTWISHLRFSPKGNALAFFEHSVTNNDGSVEVIDLPQGTKRTLVKDQHGLKGLAWTPSGGEIWYSGSNTRSPELRAVTPAGRERLVWRGPGWSEIVDIARDGRVLLLQQIPRTRIVFNSGPVTRNLSWLDWSTTADLSDDGTTLLFYEWGEAVGGVPVTYLRNTAVGEGNRLGEGKLLGEGKPLALAPKKDWVLAWKRTPAPQLILMPTGAGKVKVLPNSGIKECYFGAWFPSEKEVLAVCETIEGSVYSYVQSFDGTPARIVAPENVRAVLISPDGARLAAYGSERGTFYLIPANGGDPQPIRGLELDDELVQWSKDEGSLYVRDNDKSKVNLFKVDLASGRRRLWKTLAIPDNTGLVDIQADSTKVTPDGNTAVYTFWHGVGELYVAEGLR